MDLEEELMDLESNEDAYLPQAPHSQPRALPLTLRPPTPPSPPTSIAAALNSSRLASPTSLAAPQIDDTAGNAVSTAATTPPTSSSTVSWYDQIETLLASAEARYLEWQGELELQGSIAEEEYRKEELARKQRRQCTLLTLRDQRRAVVLSTIQSHQPQEQRQNVVHDVDVEELVLRIGRISERCATERERRPQQFALWTRLVEDLPPQERDYVARASDEMFAEQMKYPREPEETRNVIRRHLHAVFALESPTRRGQSVGKSMNHSLGQTLREFADIFHHCYGDALRSLTSAGSGGSASCEALVALLPLAAGDVNHVAAVLVQILSYKYPVLRSHRSTAHRAVLDALFDHLQPTLHGLFVAAFAPEDAFLLSLTTRMRERDGQRLEAFGIKSVFRLDGSCGADERDANDRLLRSLRQYDSVIQTMNSLPVHRSPWAKAELLASICREIDRTIKAFYATAPGTPAVVVDLNVTADDLRALLAFVLVSAPAACRNIATQLVVLVSFLTDASRAMGEEGFAIATLSSAVSHLCHLT
ncbi:hypothetical protein PINS_up000611 [Pythium insidiosum]|nr:hypothetical protein PINS_up000611 [Pythium insidiosum]